VSDGRTRRIDTIAGTLLLVFALVMVGAARREPPPGYDPLGSGSAPLWVGGALAVLALLLLAKALLGMRIAQSQQSLIVGLDGEAPPDYALRPGLAAFAMTATVGYVAALALGLGFRWSTIAFLGALGAAMSDRSPRHLALAGAVAVAGGFGIDLLFRKLLLVPLP